jgi:hypothetical protein
VLSQLREYLIEVGDQIPRFIQLDYDVIDVRFYDVAYQLPEDASHASLESSARVFEPKGHRLIAIRTKRSNEQGYELVRYAHRNLVVPGVRIEKTEGLAPCR